MRSTSSHQERGNDVPEPYVLVAQGEFSEDDRERLDALLGKLGVASEFLTPEQFEATKAGTTTFLVPDTETPDWQDPNKYSILHINSPSQWLVREHFRDYGFRMQAAPDGKKNSKLGAAFSYLLCGEGYKTPVLWGAGERGGHITIFNPSPPPVKPLPHIVVKERSALGIEPSELPTDSPVSIVAADYAIQAGSLLEYAHSTMGRSLEMNGDKLNPREIAACKLAHQLAYQMTN